MSLGPVTDPENDPKLEAVGLCHTCSRRTGVFVCTAFPDGIPRSILVGDILHTRPYPGDNGRQYLRRVV